MRCAEFLGNSEIWELGKWASWDLEFGSIVACHQSLLKQPSSTRGDTTRDRN
ncbi:MAG: hypothetical protein RMK94_16770 [Armatimonadota bacterium]|nr:hypothetical protein [Armatimonadota bacterium]